MTMHVKKIWYPCNGSYSIGKCKFHPEKRDFKFCHVLDINLSKWNGYSFHILFQDPKILKLSDEAKKG